jgi:hypothetical protein
LFVVCMYCHGELARSRPPPSRLTQFYLAVSAGGVFGGALVALGAPAVLPGYFEVEIGLVLLAATVLWRSRGRRAWLVAAAAVTLFTTAAAAYRIHDALNQVTAISRNFYGVVRIREYSADQPEQRERVLIHGRVMHGQQFTAPHRRRQPTSYYTEASGIGRLLTALQDRPIEVGAVGLGAGTIATYGKPGDRFRFYEIDEAIVTAAHRYFSFIADSPATVDVQLGDGRLLLQRDSAQRFDVLVIDAFSGDSIPVHLLTREAVALYLQRVRSGGVVALHLSNTHLDLVPVVARIAAELGLQAAFVADPGVAGDVGSSASDWVLLSTDRSILDLPVIARSTVPLPHAQPGRVWTDDYSNIVQVLSFWRTPGKD